MSDSGWHIHFSDTFPLLLKTGYIPLFNASRYATVCGIPILLGEKNHLFKTINEFQLALK